MTACNRLPKMVLPETRPERVRLESDQPSAALLAYIAWRHVRFGDSIATLAKKTGARQDSLRYWLRRGGYLRPRQETNDPRAKSSSKDFVQEVERVRKRLGVDSAYKVAREMGIDPGSVLRVARSNGWSLPKRGKMPKVAVKRLLNGECPDLVRYEGIPKLAGIKYAIWMHVVGLKSAKNVADQMETSTSVVRHWLLHYGVYSTDRQPHRDRIPYIHDPKFRERVERLAIKFDADVASIAQRTGVSTLTIRVIGREQGWLRTRERRCKWGRIEVPRNVVVNDANFYNKLVRRGTRMVLQRYGHLIENSEMLGVDGYEVDHRLTLYEGYHRGKTQVPWSLLCHPANLRVIPMRDNRIKGDSSDFGPQTLLRRVQEFNRENGVVLLPVEGSVSTVSRATVLQGEKK